MSPEIPREGPCPQCGVEFPTYGTREGHRCIPLASFFDSEEAVHVTPDEVVHLRRELASLDEQNIMQQDYLRQIRDAATIEYARGLAQEAIERSR